jgi:hypothetical protein
MQSVKTQEYLCAVDIEVLGRSSKSNVLSIGFCYGSTWENRKKFRVSIIPDSYHIYHQKYRCVPDIKGDLEDYITDVCEPALWKEFWSSRKAELKTLFSEAIPIEDAMNKLSKFIKDLYTNEMLSQGTVHPYEITFLGDNPSFDFSHIDRLLSHYCDELPLRYSNRQTSKEIRESGEICEDGDHCISDPSAQIEFCEYNKLIYYILDKYTKPTHLPDDDAERIYLQYLLLHNDEELENMKSKLQSYELLVIGSSTLTYST